MFRAGTLLFVAVLSTAAAPIPSQKPGGPTGQQNAGQEQRGTENAPVVVKVLPSDKSQADLAKEQAQEDARVAAEQRLINLTGNLATYTEGLFFATMILAGLTGILVGVGFLQVRDAKKSIKAAETSANAAQKSASVAERALTELERPFLYAEVNQFDFSLNMGGGGLGGTPALTIGRVEIALPNCGRTAAILKRLEWGVKLAPKESIPPPIDPAKVGGREQPAGVISHAHRAFTEETNIQFQFTPEEKAQVATGKASFWVIGFVRYESIFGERYILGFTIAYDSVFQTFATRGDKRYNYAHTERQEEIPPPSTTG